MSHAMPGAESLMSAPGLPAVPGAEQAISPLVQMIMRMPGHIGLASSFFEALGNFFLPQMDMLSFFDPSHLGLHLDLSAAIPGDHGSFDLSLLPHDAPLFDHLGHADLASGHSLDLASDKLNLSLGGHSHFVADGGGTSLSLGSQYNVSGDVSFAKPQFEGAGGLVSGPNLSESVSGNTLASNNRLFSDGASISSASQNMMMAGGSSAGSSLAMQPVLQSGVQTLTQSVPVAGSNISGGNLATSGSLGDNVSAHGSSANNVSYNVFEKLTGNKDILAANNVSDSYHSTIGTLQPDGATDAVSKAGSHATAGGGDNLGGLKAKPMSLDGSKVDLKADHAKLDSSSHHSSDHSTDHKADQIAEHKADSHADHKVEHKTETKVEHKAETKVADAKDVKADQTNAAAKPNHQPITANNNAAPHHAAHTEAPKAHIADKVAAQPQTQVKAPVEAHAQTHAQAAAAKAPVEAQAQAHTQTAAVKAPVEAKHLAQAAAPAANQQIVQTQSMPAANTSEIAQVDPQQQQFGEPMQNTGADTNAGTTSGPGAENAAGHDATAGQGGNQNLEQQPVQAKSYVIRSGDCLWNIAKDQLGDATKWSDIYKMNSDVLGSNPSLIHPGASINLPGADGATATGSIAHYTVKAGDNLWDIAKSQMGDATKWGDLYKANQDVIGSNPSLIQPGQELTINTGVADPANSQLSSATAQPAGNLAQAAPQGAAHAGAPTGASSTEAGTLSQNSPSIDTYGSDQAAPQIQSASEVSFSAAPVNHNIQAPSMPTPAKVMPVEAQPDLIIQPAHAAELTDTTGLSPAAAEVANGVAQSQRAGMVNTNVGADLMSFIGKRR